MITVVRSTMVFHRQNYLLAGNTLASLLPNQPESKPVMPPISPVTTTIKGADSPPSRAPVLPIKPVSSFPNIIADMTAYTTSNASAPIHMASLAVNFISMESKTTKTAGAHHGPKKPETETPINIRIKTSNELPFILERYLFHE